VRCHGAVHSQGEEGESGLLSFRRERVRVHGDVMIAVRVRGPYRFEARGCLGKTFGRRELLLG
jgi:hypothetical protein